MTHKSGRKTRGNESEQRRKRNKTVPDQRKSNFGRREDLNVRKRGSLDVFVYFVQELLNWERSCNVSD